MARQVLPWFGAAVGFVASGGNPMGAQAGFAIGSIIGNAVDPIEMQGNKLGDSPSQTAAEGGARAIVFGKGCIRATCIIERGGRRVIKQRDSSGGKGSGPTTVNERALWTYAIGLGEAIPGGAILRIWEQEKLVYDVTPGSTIPADTAAFAQRFRFHDGSEDQLPDPAIEAIYSDPTDVPYYRGTAYIVFPQRDLTDFGEAVPTYRVEVASLVAVVTVGQSVTATYTMGGNHSGAYIFPRSNGNLGFAQSTIGVSIGGTYTVGELNSSLSLLSSNSVTWLGSGYGDSRLWLRGRNEAGYGISADGNYGYCELFQNGAGLGKYQPTDTARADWWYGEDQPEFGGAVWFGDSAGGNGYWYLGVRSSGNGGYTRRLLKFQVLGGTDVPQTGLVSGVGSPPPANPAFWMTRSRDGYIHIIEADGTYRKFDDALVEVESRPLGLPVNEVRGFGVDGDVLVLVRGGGGGPTAGAYFHRISTGVLLSAVLHPSMGGDQSTRVIFTDDSCYIQCGLWIGRIPYTVTAVAGQIDLASVVASLHSRCGHAMSDYSVSELSELIEGITIEQTVTAAEAINSIIGIHWADPTDYDGRIHYIKRGKPVIRTLTINDLIDEPETWQRNNAIEYPAKVHFFGQIADLAYASVKATSARYSADVKVVGEAGVASPETFNDASRPYEIAAILHKIMWTEAGGEITWRVTDEHLDLVATDNVGLAWSGELWRARIVQIETDPGELKLKMRLDRQSAYTANLTAIPQPPPVTPPQTSIPSDTALAVMDISALTDDADDLHIVTAMSGESDSWAGGALQRSLDDGATFSTVSSSTNNAIMGLLQQAVAAASPYYTDDTNEVVVELFTDDDLHSLSQQQFLSEGGGFALSWEDGGTQKWELLQYRDATLVAPKTYRLTTLQRGRLNTEAAAHPVGAMFVLLDGAVQRQATQSGWIGTDLTHRAVSNGQSPEGADEQTLTYDGNSQREFPVANLLLERDGDDVHATAVPRHRFGTEDSPIRSLNHDGYRWAATDGANTAAAETNRDTPTWTIDATGWASPVTVTVAQLNRITGAGPTVSEEIE